MGVSPEYKSALIDCIRLLNPLIEDILVDNVIPITAEGKNHDRPRILGTWTGSSLRFYDLEEARKLTRTIHVFLHEVGHMLDTFYSFSRKPEFLEIFRAEQKRCGGGPYTGSMNALFGGQDRDYAHSERTQASEAFADLWAIINGGDRGLRHSVLSSGILTTYTFSARWVGENVLPAVAGTKPFVSIEREGGRHWLSFDNFPTMPYGLLGQGLLPNSRKDLMKLARANSGFSKRLEI